MVWIRIRSEKDGGLWSAYCDELGLASCGTTEDEAIANLKHAVIAYCRALQKRGILEITLKDKGVYFEDAPKAPDTDIANVPLSPVLITT